MAKGFKNFLLRGDVVVVAVGLIVALAFSTVISAFTTNVITPLIDRAQGKHPVGLGVQLGAKGNVSTFVNFGAFISAVIYFLIFMVVVYFVIVLPYKAISARRGVTVFGDPAPAKTCPACLSDDLPVAATKCKYCGSEQPVAPGGGA
jgi:large conductance mechanosensitive channel